MLPAVLFAVGAALCLWYGYMRYVEPQILTHTRYPLRLPLPTMRIAIVTDFHAKPTKGARFFQRVVNAVQASSPDLILLGGDLLDQLDSSLEALEPLRQLRAPLGVYSVLGNHDTGAMDPNITEPLPMHPLTEKLVAHLENFGIAMLQNRHVVLTHNGRSFALAGIGDIWSKHHDLELALKNVPADLPVLLLSHNPDIAADPLSKRACLIVSGHTHGGQFRLPFYGPLPNLRTVIGKKFDQGLFPVWESTTLLISRGVGEALTQARLLAWPEVVTVDITSTNS